MNGVYCLTAPNGKRYVGKAVRTNGKGIEYRWNDYKKLRCEEQHRLFNALKKYGVENFNYEVILETNDSIRALKVEEQLIALWNLTNDEYGLNICKGGMDVAGNEIRWNGSKSLENKKKLSMRMKDFHKTLSNEHKEARLKQFNSILHKGNETRWAGENASFYKKKQREIILKNKSFFEKGKEAVSGLNHWKAQWIKVKNEVTQEIREGQLQHLCKELGIDRPTLVKLGKTKGWILLEKRKYGH